MFDQLLSLISSIYPLSAKFLEVLPTYLTRETLPKKTRLLQKGQISKRMYFIESGLAGAYYTKRKKEVTAWFMQENELIVSVHSFFLQKPSSESIELLENSTLISIQYTDLQYLYRKYPRFNFVGRVLTERYYVLSEARAIGLREQTARERFEALLQTHPQIMNRAPLKQIASYLGMTPETLSRLRAA